MTVRTTLLLAALTLAGCHAAPLPEDAPDASRLQIDRVGELPLLGRVAIAEFSVESIDTKSRYPGPGALSFDPGTFVPPIHVLGFGVRLTTFPKGLREELPTTLLKDAVTTLEAAQVAVPTASEVSATPAYAGYEGEALVRSSFLRHFDPRGTDTGRPRRSRIYPAAGLAVPTGSPEQLSAVDRRIREQVLADATLRVRLRVGTHEGAPTLESGSTLTLSTESGTLTATLPRTLVSVDSTSKPETWLPVRGFHVKVKRGAYRTAIRRLVASFLQRALRDALGPVYARASLIQR